MSKAKISVSISSIFDLKKILIRRESTILSSVHRSSANPFWTSVVDLLSFKCSLNFATDQNDQEYKFECSLSSVLVHNPHKVKTEAETTTTHPIPNIQYISTLFRDVRSTLVRNVFSTIFLNVHFDLIPRCIFDLIPRCIFDFVPKCFSTLFLGLTTTGSGCLPCPSIHLCLQARLAVEGGRTEGGPVCAGRIRH